MPAPTFSPPKSGDEMMILEKHWASVRGRDALKNDSSPVTMEDFHYFTNWERIISSLTLVQSHSSWGYPAPSPLPVQAPRHRMSMFLGALKTWRL